MADLSRHPQMPHSIDAERALLGALMIDNGALDIVAAYIRAEDFYLSAHSTLFEAIVYLIEKKRPADMVSLTEYLMHSEQLEKIGGATYLAELLEAVPSAANINHYATIVRDKSVKRQLAIVLSEALEDCLEGSPAGEKSEDVNQIIEKLQQKTTELWEPERGIVTQEEAFSQALDDIEIWGAGHTVTGTPYNIDFLDKITGGRHPGQVVIIAGRESMGKSILGAQVCCRVEDTLVFTLDTDAREMATRELLAESGLSREDIIENRDISEVINAATWLLQKNRPRVYFDEVSNTVEQIIARIRYEKKRRNIGGVLIDYFQLIQTPGKDTRTNELQFAGRKLKALAKELQINLTLISNLNRDGAKINRPPQTSDLRDCGDLEYAAHVIIMIHAKTDENGVPDSKCHIFTRKNKNGPKAMNFLYRDGARFRFLYSSKQDGPPIKSGYDHPNYTDPEHSREDRQ